VNPLPPGEGMVTGKGGDAKSLNGGRKVDFVFLIFFTTFTGGKK
jgi:hypothetical protein